MLASITISSDEVLNRTGGGEGCSTWPAARQYENVGGRLGGKVGSIRNDLDVPRACRVLVLEVDTDGSDLKASANED